MKTNEIHGRDPFVMPYNGKYYMYVSNAALCWGMGGNFNLYISDDLENWSEPIEIFKCTPDFWSDRHFWAPEVHEYNGAFYLFASFNAENINRGTAILKSETPEGPFKPHSDGPVTPSDMVCLDGTLFCENGRNYMVFCHEWTQVYDGGMCAIELSSDLKSAIGEPKTLFTASSAPWARPITIPLDITNIPNGVDCYVTDGPFFHRTKGSDLLMLWSSFGESDNYVLAVARSNDGTLFGKWIHEPKLLFDKDGGHGMIFRKFDGTLMLTLHSPNELSLERPAFFELAEVDNALVVKP